MRLAEHKSQYWYCFSNDEGSETQAMNFGFHFQQTSMYVNKVMQINCKQIVNSRES